MSERAESIREESLWFGDDERPLFGRLTLPTTSDARGGVLLSPPIGREGRLARRALRSLAINLAKDGFVCLRFDHFGTGDSSGSLDDGEFVAPWLEGIDLGVSYLRSLGVATVAAVGMRMGATILGVAAATYDLDLSSLVLWDPCESGRNYLRELTALSALRRDVDTSKTVEAQVMSEFPFSEEGSAALIGLSLTTLETNAVARRVLLITRDDRSVSGKFRTRWESNHVEWVTSSEQGHLLDAELPSSNPPVVTLKRIRSWLGTDAKSSSALSETQVNDTVDIAACNTPTVRERIAELGPRGMFGVVTEPIGALRGPLIAFVNGINEDHVGPSRLWVELSRRWAGMGLRCVRFDLMELGESPWHPERDDRAVFDKSRTEDIREAITALTDDPSESVLIGLCSGAQLALGVTLDLKLRGICAINPQVGSGVLRNAVRMERSERKTIRSFAQRFDGVLQRHRWIGRIVWQIARIVLPSPYSHRVKSQLARNGSEMLLLVSGDEIYPFPWIPIIGKLDRRRLVSTDRCRIEIVPGLDHDFLSATARPRAVEILVEHVRQKFVVSAPLREPEHSTPDS